MSAADRRKVNVGIAGLGRSGWRIHARLLEALPTKYRVAAVFDPDRSRMQEARDRFGCTTCGSYAELVGGDETELIVVATPNKRHTEDSLAALRAGKHVVCEKPFAANLKDADRMIAAARRRGLVLSGFQNRRYAADFLQVRKVISSGVLGRVVHVRMTGHKFARRWDWQTLKRLGGGTLNNTGPHFIDQALCLFGDRKPNVFCLRDRALSLGDADDHVKIILSGGGSPTIEIEDSAACPYPQDYWLVMGTQGGLSGSRTELRWTYFNPARVPRRAVDTAPTPDRGYNTEALPMVEKAWSAENDRGPGHKAFYMDLFKSLRDGQPLAVPPEMVRRQMWVMEECRRQAPV